MRVSAVCGPSKHETFTNAGTMLVQRRRRWANIVPALDARHCRLWPPGTCRVSVAASTTEQCHCQPISIAVRN